MTKKTAEFEIFVDQSALPAAIDEVTSGQVTDIYAQEGGLKPYYMHVKRLVDCEVFDATTEDGRKRINAVARKISSSKTLLEKPGREYLRKLKASVKPIEANIKEYVDMMDALRDKVKRPADEWQAEQDRAEQEKQNVIDFFSQTIATAKEQLPHMAPATQVEQIQMRIESVQVFDIAPAMERVEEATAAKQDCLVTLQGYLSYAEKELERAAQTEAERIKQIEARAREEAIKSNQAQLEQAELDKAAAEQRANQERANAEKRAEVAAQAARDEENARHQREREEAARLAADAEQAERAKSEDLEHRKAVNIESRDALLALNCGLTREQAQEVVKAAVLGNLGRIRVYY